MITSDVLVGSMYDGGCALAACAVQRTVPAVRCDVLAHVLNLFGRDAHMAIHTQSPASCSSFHIRSTSSSSVSLTFLLSYCNLRPICDV